MNAIQPGEQVISMAPDRESIEIHTVVRILPDGMQLDGASGKISRRELRKYDEAIVNRIREKENQLKTIKSELKSLYETLGKLD
jgi:hypothetical protein